MPKLLKIQVRRDLSIVCKCRQQDESLFFRVALELNWQDMWIECFWDKRGDGKHIWLCLLPCLPIHLQWVKRPWSTLETAGQE